MVLLKQKQQLGSSEQYELNISWLRNPQLSHGWYFPSVGFIQLWVLFKNKYIHPKNYIRKIIKVRRGLLSLIYIRRILEEMCFTESEHLVD